MIPAPENPIPAAETAATALLPGATAPSVVSILVAPSKGAAMRELAVVRAVPGRGLEGDRYFDAALQPGPDATRASAVTLIEAEALDALARDHDVRLDAAGSRRNLLTRGVALNDLVGREFCVGRVVLRGVALCEPCLHLQRATGTAVLRGLVHRGGLRAEIVVGGIIRSGDPVSGLSTDPLSAPGGN